MPTPTRADVERAVESVPPEDGVIVHDAATGKTLAHRDPARPPIEHSAVLIVFNPPPFAPADPRSRTLPDPLAPSLPPAGGSAGDTPEGTP